jgi:hypothetical protein
MSANVKTQIATGYKPAEYDLKLITRVFFNSEKENAPFLFYSALDVPRV